MALDANAIKKIASLARLKIPESDIEPLKEDLNKILGWVEQLSEVDTDGVEPMTSVADMELQKRKDEVSDGDYTSDILRNAPLEEKNFFVVPKVVE